ncbi:MAG: hypothetical protein WBB82_06385 [Limnothrix sp.]
MGSSHKVISLKASPNIIPERLNICSVGAIADDLAAQSNVTAAENFLNTLNSDSYT